MNASLHPGEDIAPIPGDLVESLRDFGYTLPSALADLVDNSLTAKATEIEAYLEADGPDSYVAVVDNGRGMDQKTLVEAMRMGTKGPLAARSDNDLGRFGLGMKTASLSQGTRLTVITKASDRPTLVRRWDVGHIRKSAKWELLTDPTAIAAPFVDKIDGMCSGTAVIVEDLDRATYLKVAASEVKQHFGRSLDSVRRHLAMVFHRFIEDGVTICLGSTALPAWDPFLKKQSTKLATEHFALLGKTIDIVPYVLPHHSHLTDEQHDDAAGPNGWNAHQGFYLYRCRRLILPGSWLNLHLRKEEHFKLARIQVDLPNSMDAEWHLNVTKSQVAAPAALRDDFARVARNVRSQAAAVYRIRGERHAPSNAPPHRFVWKREESRGAVRYRIDRTHPVVQALLHGGCEHAGLLGEMLELIERTVPIATMLQDPVKSLEGAALESDEKAAEQFVDMMLHAERFLISAGKTPADARQIVMNAEPFVHFREVLSDMLNKI
ncbi:MAG: ATP-binding protein [Gammaproteobacteria bacterium]|nr:ATP-binding protein [Gammaproteobacteria bacterium]